jgi:hypothetical protein
VDENDRRATQSGIHATTARAAREEAIALSGEWGARSVRLRKFKKIGVHRTFLVRIKEKKN